MSSPASSLGRPAVARRPTTVGVLKRQRSSRNLHKMEEKAANHDAMMKKFNLRKMSSGIGMPSKFSRSSEVVIDKAIGTHKGRRYSLHRSIRVMTSAKTRKNVLQALTSPISPKSWASTCHGILMLAVFHFQLLYLPFWASYYPNDSFGTATIAMSLETIFLMNVLLNFNTSYVEQGVLVRARRKIAQKYIRTWFAFDALSAIPMQFICYFFFTNKALRGVQTTLMVLRLIRLTVIERGVLVSRVMRVANPVMEWARYSRYSHLLGIVQLMWLVLLIAHYMACFWHVVSRQEQLTQLGSVGEKYVADYYYAVSLIQGQGNISCAWDENAFSSAAMILGSVILAIVFGNVAMLVSNFNANTTNYHRKMEAVYETMAKMDLPLRLRERVNEYYKHVWLEYESLDGNVNKFQQELTHTLGIEVGLYKHMNLVLKVPFWKDCTPDFLTQIVLNLDVRVYMPDDYVVRRRETGSEMMMLNRGYCKLLKSAKIEDDEETGESMLKPMMSMYNSNQATEMEEFEATDSENDSSDDWSSDDEELEVFGGGLFGASMDSRRLSGTAPGHWEERADDFTDVRRFQTGRPRRLSYPAGAYSNKSRKYREYLRPCQAFGEMSLLMNYKRTANIRAITFVEMCVLSRKSFQKIISRYPEDRRRVLTAMLQNCIEKKLIPFPWEDIIQAVTAKRRHDGNKDFSRASVIATVTAKEAARILVEAIDINTPDDSIKYGFQSFDQGFVDDSSRRQANSVDTKISDTLRNSRLRSMTSFSSDVKTQSNEGNSELDVESEKPSTPGSGQSDRTLKSLLVLVQNMAGNIEQLQQDVSDLRSQDRERSHRCNCSDVISALSHRHSLNSQFSFRTTSMKEEHQTQTPRKPSFVAVPRSSASDSSQTNSRTGSRKSPIAVLRKVRSTMQENSHVDSTSGPQSSRVVPDVGDPPRAISNVNDTPVGADRYPVSLSGRSKAARNPTLTDLLWKRSNTSGDLLKHTEAERSVARLKRQIRTWQSLPSEMAESTHDEDGAEIHEPSADFDLERYVEEPRQLLHHGHLVPNPSLGTQNSKDS